MYAEAPRFQNAIEIAEERRPRILEITKWGKDEILRQSCAPVKNFDEETRNLIADMTATLKRLRAPELPRRKLMLLNA
jgi:hypothetical protein